LTIQDNSLDFIICNHMLEHCENPLGTLRSHMRKLKVGGVIYLAVPDKRFTFDAKREITSFDHLIADDQNGPEASRLQHFHEWVRYPMEIEDPEQIEQKARELMEINYSIHYHVWDNAAFQEFLVFARVYLQRSFEVEHVQTNRSMSEIISILRRVQ
jgi:predicted SAM-dependent methyltransferase